MRLIERALIPKSPILLLDKLKLIFDRFFKPYKAWNFNPFYVKPLPIKFSFNVVNL
jgi:hypothetical protein